MNVAFDYIKENGGIDTENCYPYTAKVKFVHHTFNFVNFDVNKNSSIYKSSLLDEMYKV